MYRPRLTVSLSILSLTALLSAGCGTDESAPRSEAATTSSSPVTSAAPPATVEGLEDEVAPPDASFPASTADDSGEEQRSSTAGTSEDMLVTGIRLLPQNGYDRLIVDLNTNGISPWTARYSDASTPAGDPVAVAGDSFLRLGLFTNNSSAEPVAAVLGESGVVAEVRSTGSLGGYQEVLIGVRGAPAPFRTFGLTDPGRIVIDIRPAG
jgi:hypothetical protein